MKSHAIINFGGLVLLFLFGCFSTGEKPVKVETFPVRVEKPSRETLEETLLLVGSLKAKDEATLFSRVPGKLLSNLVKEGDWVSKNQPVSLVERDEVGVKFEPAPVPSTISGIIARMYLDRGANVTLSTPVALVVDQRNIIVQGDIPERYAGKVHLNQLIRISVEAYPEKLFEGKISRLSPVVDSTTRSAYMEASFDNTKKLLQSGMFAKVWIVIGKKEKALSIPIEAFQNNSNSVFIHQNGKAIQKPIEMGIKTDTRLEILSGISETDEVITFGLFGLKNESPVEILP